MHIAVPDFVSSTFIPLIAADELGFFKVEGLDIEIVHIPALGDVEAVISSKGASFWERPLENAYQRN